MIVGCLGDISFAVFDSHVETIKNMVQNVSARYTTHQRAGGPALTEFTGTDAQTITFDIELAAYLGVNPTKERERLQECVLNGTTLPFVLGNVVYGSYRWVIKSVKFKTLHTDAFGTPTCKTFWNVPEPSLATLRQLCIYSGPSKVICTNLQL